MYVRSVMGTSTDLNVLRRIFNVVYLCHLMLTYLDHCVFIRINFFDFYPNSSDFLAYNVGKNTGSLWSNIATLNWPNGLVGPSGETCCPLYEEHILGYFAVNLNLRC